MNAEEVEKEIALQTKELNSSFKFCIRIDFRCNSTKASKGEKKGDGILFTEKVTHFR